MYNFFEYCFYRICYVYYKRKIDKQPYIYACGWVTFAQLLNIITVINTYHLFNNSTYDAGSWIWPITIPLYVINYFLLLSKEKYNGLVERYKNNKNRKIKGWGVFLYIIGSFILFMYTGYKLFWVPATSFS